VPFLEQFTCGHFPVHENSEESLHYGFSGKFDGPSGTSIRPPDVEPGRPDEQVEFLAPEGGADKLLACLHLLRRALVEQERPEDFFQLPHFLDWCRCGTRWQVLELDLAAGWWHRFSWLCF